MSKKNKTQKQTGRRKTLFSVEQIKTTVEENKNLIYIAIIGFCLSVTIIYKLGQFFGWWK